MYIKNCIKIVRKIIFRFLMIYVGLIQEMV